MEYTEKTEINFEHLPQEFAADEFFSDRISLLMKLRNSGVRDISVLAAIEKVPRELFAPDAFLEHSYNDTALPIEFGQAISQPSIVARMTEELKVKPNMRVLEVGTGSGYQAAVLARLARRVYTIERHRDLLARAEQRFVRLGFTNIVTKRGDGAKGWKEASPFDRIMVTAAAEKIPETLLMQLANGGIMILPVGEENSIQSLLKVVKDESGNISTKHLINVRFVPLVEGDRR